MRTPKAKNSKTDPSLRDISTFSGNLPLRISPKLHQKLAILACNSDISINQYLENMIINANLIPSLSTSKPVAGDNQVLIDAIPAEIRKEILLSIILSVDEPGLINRIILSIPEKEKKDFLITFIHNHPDSGLIDRILSLVPGTSVADQIRKVLQILQRKQSN